MRQQAELGRLLAAATGYRVRTTDGREVGLLKHVRYQRHSEYPDELIVRPRFLGRRRVIPFTRVQTIEPRERVMLIRSDLAS